MELTIKKAGLLTTVQDLGRWGCQSSGVPVAGAMDLHALRLGNIMVGCEIGAAALEVTLAGPEIAVAGEGLAVFVGAELGFAVNGKEVGSWQAVALKDGDLISFRGTKCGCRGYLCFAGGIDVPLVMGSRSTYTRAKIGGYQGRALKSGDVLKTGEPNLLWRRNAGFVLPQELRPDYQSDRPLKIIQGLQQDAFTEAGLATLFGSEYTVTNESDRMGCRFEGPQVEHAKSADIVSDAIPLGAVQIPGHGLPIVMLADRQTTGGYTKVGVLTQAAIEALAQKAPGSKVRFERISMKEAVAELKAARELEAAAAQRRCSWCARPAAAPVGTAAQLSNRLKVTVDGKSYDVTCEEIK